jgi:hypothetical protein
VILLTIKLKEGMTVTKEYGSRRDAQEDIDSLYLFDKIDGEEWSQLFDELSKIGINGMVI